MVRILQTFNQPLVWTSIIFIYIELISNHFTVTEILSTFFWGTFSLWIVGYGTTDIWHAFCHKYDFLWEKFHKLHHEAFASDMTFHKEKLMKSKLTHDLSEIFLMFFISTLFLFLLYKSCTPGWIGAIYPCLSAVNYSYNAVRIRLGDVNCLDLAHKPQKFEKPPNEWLVDPAGHFLHHNQDMHSYISGKLKLYDKLMGTANGLLEKRIFIFSNDLEGDTADVSLLNALKTEVGNEHFVSSSLEIDLTDEELQKIDVLIISSASKFQDTTDLISRFLATVKNNRDVVMKELWVFIDEREIDGKFLSTVVSDARQSARCRVRKIIMTGSHNNNSQTAKQITQYVKQDRRTIVLGSLRLRFIYIVREILNSIIWRCLNDLNSRSNRKKIFDFIGDFTLRAR